MIADDYKRSSITLLGAVAMGTGVMIGARIFALTGQIAKLAGSLFRFSFTVGAFVTAFSAHTDIKMQNLFFAFASKALGVPIAAGLLYPVTGLLLSPMIAAAAMSLSAVSVITNALRLRRIEL